MRELEIDALVENLDNVNDFVHEELDDIDCSKKSLMQLGIVIEEIFVNIASYAYPEKVGKAIVRCEVTKNPPEIVLTFIDSGIKYNPLANEDPDLELELHERQIGGLGVFMVKKLTDEVTYEYTDGKNILKFRKVLS